MIYVQRIYDSSQDKFVYYSLGEITTEPAAEDTSPNHGGVEYLVASTHVILQKIADGEITVENNGVTISKATTNINFIGDVTVTGEEGSVTVDVGRPIWEWNGIDTSQFMSASTATWTQGNITSTGLSVVDSANVIGGKVLRFSAAASDANGMAVHLINFDFPLNFRIEYELDKFAGGTSNPLYYWGFALLADNTDNSFHAYLAFAANGTGATATGGAGQRVDAGVASGGDHSNCGFPGNNITSARQRIYIEQRADLTPSPPYVRFMRSAYRITGSVTTTSYLVCQDSYPGSAASSWAGRACNKLGLAVHRTSTAGTNTSHQADIAALRVYKL